MYQTATYPAEAPVLDSEPSKRSRLPLVLFGARSNPDNTGWTREERAVQAGRVPNASHQAYLGPHVPYDHAGSDESWRAALADLMIWRFEAGIVRLGGVVVPHWGHYDVKHQQQLAAVVRHVLTREEHSGVAQIAADSAGTFRFKRAEMPLPIYRARAGRLEEILRPPAPHSEANVLEELQAFAPTTGQLITALMSNIAVDRPTRGFAAACEVARDASARGRSGRWIRTYLETFGYVNRTGTAGRWHPARLAEALNGAVR
jgi:hypothetical protein